MKNQTTEERAIFIHPEQNDDYFWFIKDNDGNFAHKNSIGKSEGNTWLYVAYKTYNRGCRDYISKQHAESALVHLNKIKDMVGMDLEFHIEKLNQRELILEHRKFQGENIVILEKKDGKIAWVS